MLKRTLAALLMLCVPLARADAPAGQAVGSAVVELFTSEGCDSCPPADRNLAEIAADAHTGNRPVYALEWHVDYWNRLGWTDPFSTAAASARQSDYSKAFRLDEVYTPQMIVNGNHGFVGSKIQESRDLIAKALAKPASAVVTVDQLKLTGRDVSLHYTVDFAGTKALPGSVLIVAATEDALTTHVKTGENGGRILKHAAVVRTFAEIALASALTGQTTLTLPAAADLKHIQLVAFVQEKPSMAILGATGTALPAKDSPR